MQYPISVLIIEEDELWTLEFQLNLQNFGFNICNSVNNYNAALLAIHANNFDIAVVNINLNGENCGIELGRMIDKQCKKPYLFITNSISPDVFLEIAAARPSGFLSSLIPTTVICSVIQNAMNHFQTNVTELPTPPSKSQPNNATFFFVKHGNKYKRIDWQLVICLRSEKNYTCIVTCTNEGYLIRSSLQKTIHTIIPEILKQQFVQVNRAEVLQISYIDEIINDDARIGQRRFNITDSYIKNLKYQLNILL